VFDQFPIGFYFVITATMVILFLAANTAFNGFPVLGSILARDGFLPRMLHTRGDRLAYSNGILVLAGAAIALVLTFNANVTALIQLYVVGVFVSFTVSQFGMTRHWTRHLKTEKDPKLRSKMKRSRVINTVGLTGTGIVLIIVLASKFIYGAYLAVIAMVIVFLLMRAIQQHYRKVAVETAVGPADARLLPSRVRAVILVQEINKPTMRAVNFARATRASTIEAVLVSVDDAETKRIVQQWDEQSLDLALKVIASPYREVTGPFINYVRGIRSDNPRDVVCVYIPEYIVGHWWEQLLHNQTGLIVRTRLNFMQGVMVTSVPYQLASSKYAQHRAERHTAAAWRRPGRGQVRLGDYIDPERKE
ncbi:MAG TPA: DNA-binding protein, partial [Propionibacteriaceae bacterium]|nr:DNA-binding protein [Propionibacteriaceae bacterium]